MEKFQKPLSYCKLNVQLLPSYVPGFIAPRSVPSEFSLFLFSACAFCMRFGLRREVSDHERDRDDRGNFKRWIGNDWISITFRHYGRRDIGWYLIRFRCGSLAFATWLD